MPSTTSSLNTYSILMKTYSRINESSDVEISNGIELKVLMLVTKLNFGGTENYILSMSRMLRKHGAKVGIAAKKGPLSHLFSKAGIKLHLMPKDKNENLTSSLSSLMIKEKYNLIHAHDSKTFVIAASIAQKLNIPFIATVHGTYHKKAALSAAARAAKKMITVSPKLTKWLLDQKVTAQKIRMIPNGIDLRTFHPITDSGKWKMALRFKRYTSLLVYAGRFSKDKYRIARNVILAAERIAIKNPQFVALLIGPGSRRVKLVKLANQINRRLRRKAILIRPAMFNIQQAYAAADIVVGTGRVAIEAMACGKPVVAIGVAGYSGTVRKQNINKMIQYQFGDHGALSKLSVAKLTKDIRSLLGNPMKARKMGDFNAKLAQRKFSVQTTGSRMLKVYKDEIRRN